MNELNALLHQIYDIGDDRLSLTDLLGVLVQSIGSDSSHIFLVDQRGAVVESAATGHDDTEKTNAIYHERFQADDPRLKVGMIYEGQVHSDVDCVDQAAFDRSELCDFLEQYGSRYAMFATVKIAPDLVIAPAFMRSRVHGHFYKRDTVFFEQILPHLGRALRLRRTLQLMRAGLSDLRRALDALPLALLIVDALGSVLCANQRAEKLLTDADALFVGGRRLTAKREPDASRLAAAIRDAARVAEWTSRRPIHEVLVPPLLRILRPGRRALGVVIMPLSPRTSVRGEEQRARVLVAIHDAEADGRIDPGLIASMFDLTEAEAAITSALCAGDGVAEIARARGSSIHTVRTHLKRILEKTQTRRQAELVQVVFAVLGGHLRVR